MITQLGKSNCFTLGANGMESLNRVHVSRGTKIFAYGYAMNEQLFVVYDDNMNAVEIARSERVEEYELDRYFSPLHHLEDTIRPISKQFGIGFYYDESGEVISDDVIELSLKRAENWKKLKQEVKERKQREKEELREQLIKDYPYLTRIEKSFDHKTCGNNIRTELKRNFPNVKFSVRYSSFSGGDSYDISWYDGPLREDVDAIVGKYRDMHPDEYSQGDYWDCKPSVFNNLFGSVGYVCCNRHLSDKAGEKVLKIYPELNENNYKTYIFDNRELYSAIHRRNNPTFDDVLELVALYTDLTEKPTERKQISVEGLKIEDYSEKSFILVGDTMPIKDELKKIGGIWLRNKKCWCFSNKKRQEIEDLIK